MSGSLRLLPRVGNLKPHMRGNWRVSRIAAAGPLHQWYG
jgi:hypothetical protein